MVKKKLGLSIVIPVFNSEGWIGRTLQGIETSLKASRFDAEIIIVDDGSTDGSVEEVKVFKSRYKGKLTLIEQGNTGRYIARKVGVDATSNDSILFIDSRIDVGEGALRFLSGELESNQDQIWNGHVNVAKKGNIFARFWDSIVYIAWRKYFKKPEKTSYGIDDFDHYPKGTGFFFVPKKRLVAAMSFFEENANDLRYSSDDTLLIRYLAERQPINLSPEFSCVYHGRSTFKGFLRHAYSRGQFFVDGFLRRGTRFFYPLLAVLLVSIIAVLSLAVSFLPSIFYILIAALLFAVGLFFGALVMGAHVKDAGALSLLGVPFGVVYLAGIWRGVARKVRKMPFGYIFSLSGVAAFTKNIWSVVKKQRTILRGSILEYLSAGALYLVALTVITKGIMFNLGDRIFSGIGDGTAGFMWLNYAEPGINPVLGLTDEVNYPVGEVIGSPTHITYYAIWIPMRFMSVMFGPVAGLNIMMIIGFLLAAVSAYWLVKRITGNTFAAFFAGYAAAFVPYAVIKSSGHLAYIFSGVFTVMLASFVAFWKKPNIKRSALLAVSIALAFYTDGYFVLLASVMTVGLVGGGFIFSLIRRTGWKSVTARIKGLAIALGVLIVLVAPIGITQLTQGSDVGDTLSSARPGSIEQEIVAYRSNIMDFLVPPLESVIYGPDANLETVHNYKNLRSNGGESMNYVSKVIILLCSLGMAILILSVVLPRKFSLSIRKSEIDSILLVACTVVVAIPLFIMFMFSPEIHIAGLKITLPGQVFIDMDLNMWRVMSRFFVPLHAMLAVFAALSMYIIYRYISPYGRSVSRSRGVVAGGLMVVLIVACALDYAVDMRGRPFSFSVEVPKVYSWIKEQSDVDVIAELPLVDPLDGRTAKYVTYQIVHGKKLINTRDPIKERINNALGEDNNPETIDFLRKRGADLVLIRADNCQARAWGVLVQEGASETPGVKICVYRLSAGVSSDGTFMVFGSGFKPTADSVDTRSIRLNESRGIFWAANSGLVKGVDYRVHLDALVRVDSEEGSSWRVYQNKTIVASGVGSGSISVDFDGREPLSIVIYRYDKETNEGGATLDNVVVTDVSR